MKPYIHLILSFPIAVILYFFFKEYAFIFLLASFIFDIDHYIDYAVATKTLSLKKAYIDCKKAGIYTRKYNHVLYKDRLHVFHTIEFYLMILILAFYYKSFLFIFIGLMFHQLIDFIDALQCPILLQGRAMSLIMWLKRRLF